MYLLESLKEREENDGGPLEKFWMICCILNLKKL